jgi:hypothetical protein
MKEEKEVWGVRRAERSFEAQSECGSVRLCEEADAE